MASLRAESRAHAARIRALYAPEVRRLAIANRQALRTALDDARLRPLSIHGGGLGIRPRLTGRQPIAELDLPHQQLYLAARPETLGCLLHVAAHVRSGPLDVTSLVRHRAYQRALGRRNRNARTTVPTHVMGLAFDVSILHVPLATAREIRDVLRRMAADGDLLFLAEQRQLVFHVVPSPTRRSYYAALYDARRSVRPPALPSPEWPGAPAAPRPTDRAEPHGEASPPSLRPVEYAAFFGWLVTAGLGVPPGEDLLLAGTGALASSGVLAWWPLVLIGIGAVVTSDAMLFFGGRAVGGTLTRRLTLVPAPLAKRLARIGQRAEGLAIVVARFVPGFRTVMFVSAGARGVRPRTFLLIDACAAAVWVPFIMTAGASLWAAATGDPAALLPVRWR